MINPVSRCWDSNSRPPDREFPPITTGPASPLVTRGFASLISKWTKEHNNGRGEEKFFLHFSKKQFFDFNSEKWLREWPSAKIIFSFLSLSFSLFLSLSLALMLNSFVMRHKRTRTLEEQNMSWFKTVSKKPILKFETRDFVQCHDLEFATIFLNGPTPASSICLFFLKMGQSRPLFQFIFVFSIWYNLNSNFNWKKRRWCAWDSNPGRQDGRRKWIHWAMAAPLYLFIFVFLNKHHYNYYNKYMWKMSIQYTVPEFKPTTFGTRVSSHNH